MAGLSLPLSRAAALLADTSPLGMTWDGDNIHVSARRLRFLSGRPLARLKDGATVVFLSQVTLLTNARTTVLRRANERFVVSYDLWEEKFSIMRPGINAQKATRLSANEAEAWCLDNLPVPVNGLAPDTQFWVRFEMRTADGKELASAVGEPGISITRLIEIFSRKPDAQEPNWQLETGPVRLQDLPRTPPARGPRNG